MISWITALSFIYPTLIFELYNSFYRYMSKDPNGPLLSVLKENRQEMIFWLVVMQVFFLMMTFFITIFMSHRIAGPLYKLGKALNELRNGNLSKIYFRKFDHFKELADDYNLAVESLKDSVQVIELHVEKALAANPNEAARKELEDCLKTLKQFKTS
ncbi:MAG: methyl-accepting chemotaxis protein [Proteobacteria bacterium]|nr:MAG: methyl-accepting chemotaxis protein [Pseudomonadota bacterium]